jgi:carbon monoxide dehydrogenase subunit G
MMQLEHTFTVPVDPVVAWEALMDVERVAPCFPGASVESVSGDDISGAVKVKLGPIGLTYRGTAQFVERNEAEKRMRLTAKGRDVRGNGSATAEVIAVLSPDPAGTRVQVRSDMELSGKPAQFGRGVISDVAGKLVTQFADNLAAQLSHASPAAAQGAAPQSATIDSLQPRAASDDVSLNLWSVAGGVVVRRAAPYLVAAASAAGLTVVIMRRRQR